LLENEKAGPANGTGLLIFQLVDRQISTVTIVMVAPVAIIAITLDSAFVARLIQIAPLVIGLPAVKAVAIDRTIQFAFLFPYFPVARVVAIRSGCSRDPSASKHHQGAQHDRQHH